MIRATTLLLVGAIALPATAEEVAPGDVTFGEYGEVAAALTGQAGDPANGRVVFMDRKLGNCLACHENADMADQPFHGEVGPSLDGVADRWEAADLRGIIVNSKGVFPETIMPAFYKADGYNRNAEKFVGQTILSAQQVEDVIAYLQTLKED